MSDGAKKKLSGCPDCYGRLVTRTSEWFTSLYKESYLQCMNLECGATFKSFTEIAYRLSPSGTPNPEVKLPYTEEAIKRQVAAKKD